MNYASTSLVKSVLSFFWVLPFFYLFLTIYFDLNLKLSEETFRILLFISFLCAFILIAVWFREFRETSNLTNSFKYLKSRNLEKLDALLNRTTNPSKYTENDTTLLQYAIDNQIESEIVSYLLTKGCSVVNVDDTQYSVDYTLFYLCSYYNHLNNSLIGYLLSKGANINFIDRSKGFNGLSIVQSLVLRGDKSSILLALEQGAKINYSVEDLAMNTMMLAAKYVDDPLIIKLLIDQGANINEVNKNGYNALLFAAHYNPSPAVVATIVNAGGNLRSYHVKSALLNYNEITALMLASNYNNALVVKKLIQLGDNLDFKDSLGLNALFVAAAHNTDVDVIKTLITAGLSLERARDKDGNTPLMAAAFLNSNPIVIKYLIDKTHNLNSTNNDGFSFIEYLKQNQNLTHDEKSVILNRWV